MDVNFNPVEQLKKNLELAGVGAGSTLLVHSGLGDILLENTQYGQSHILYARQIVAMLMQLVGVTGTLVMSTDSIANPREFSYNFRVFNPDKMPSRRGTITEVFRRHPGVLRSRHPWCNASAWGAHAEWLITDHLLSTPFAMDQHSPWFRLTELDSKIVFIGIRPRTADLCIVLPEHILGFDYPVGAFLDKTVVLNYLSDTGEVARMPVYLNVHDWSKSEVQSFLDYLDAHYGLFRFYGKGATRVAICGAKSHLDALFSELAKGHYYPHARYWL